MTLAGIGAARVGILRRRCDALALAADKAIITRDVVTAGDLTAPVLLTPELARAGVGRQTKIGFATSQADRAADAVTGASLIHVAGDGAALLTTRVHAVAARTAVFVLLTDRASLAALAIVTLAAPVAVAVVAQLAVIVRVTGDPEVVVGKAAGIPGRGVGLNLL